MERSPLATLAALGIVAVLVMALMWLFALNQVSDTTAAQSAAAIDQSLSRSMEPESKSRVTMILDGKGVSAPRRYIVRYRPSVAVAADAEAIHRLAERAARIVVANLDHVKGEASIHCVAELGPGRDAQACFRRTGAAGAWDLAPVVPVPPLPDVHHGASGEGDGGGAPPDDAR